MDFAKQSPLYVPFYILETKLLWILQSKPFLHFLMCYGTCWVHAIMCNKCL
jgi:hypothetical protein